MTFSVPDLAPRPFSIHFTIVPKPKSPHVVLSLPYLSSLNVFFPCLLPFPPNLRDFFPMNTTWFYIQGHTITKQYHLRNWMSNFQYINNNLLKICTKNITTLIWIYIFLLDTISEYLNIYELPSSPSWNTLSEPNWKSIYFISFHIVLKTRVCTRSLVWWKETFCVVYFYLKHSGPASKPNSASCVQSLGAKSTIGSWLSLSVSISNTVLSSPLSCREIKNNEMIRLLWFISDSMVHNYHRHLIRA